jgi:uncharacterized protein
MTSEALLDCDTHFTDHPSALWSPDSVAAGLPQVPEVVDVDGHQRLRIGDMVFPRPSGPGQGNPRGLGHLIGPGQDEDRAAFMTKHGISTAVLQPGFVGLSFQAVADPVARTALAGACNSLAARASADSALDLRWAILLSTEDPDWSLQQIDRYRDDPNVVGAVVRPTARGAAVRLSDPALDAALEALAEARLTLFMHGGTGCHQWSPLADAYAAYPLTHAFGHMGEHMIAMTDLLLRPTGLPEQLRVVMLESGVAWIPPVLERLSAHHRRLSSGSVSPTELMKRHIAVVPDPAERLAPQACEELGVGNLLFGSDYPHWDTVDPAEWLEVYGELCSPAELRANTAAFVPRMVREAAK